MKRILLLLSFYLFVIAVTAQITINVPAAGGFSSALAAAGGNEETITNLTVTGNINALDIKFMRDNMPALAVLDLTNVSILAYNGTDGPGGSLVSAYPANEMPTGSFNQKTSLTSIKLPNSILSIGSAAFLFCSGLTCELKIPSSVKSIGIYAFSDCSGFTGNLVIPESVPSIALGVFRFCSGLTSVTIPGSVSYLDIASFMQCTALQQIIVNNAKPPVAYPTVFEGVNTTTCEIVVPKGSISAYQQANYWKDFITVTEGYKVQFNTMGGSVVSDALCYNACLPAPVAPVKLGFIFYGWYKEEACANIWDFNTDIVTTNITLYAKWIKGITVKVTAAGDFSKALAAAGNDAKTITNIAVTGNIDARDIKFMRDNIPLLSILDLSSASIIAYNGTGGTFFLTDPLNEAGILLNYPANEMPERSFRGKTSLTSIKLPNSISCIGRYAFDECKGLSGSLTIPNSVSSIDYGAFSGCRGFTGNLTIPNSVTSIRRDAFAGCIGFTGNLTIPNSVTSIDPGAFSGCIGFTGNLTIPNSVASIGGGAFSGCSGFTGSLTIPNSVTSISSMAFSGCSGFTGNLNIPNSVTSIGRAAFEDCSGLTGNLNIPNLVTSIERVAFSGCSGLTGNLTIPNSVTLIEEGAFADCSGFTGNLNIPSSVTSVESYAFQGCKGFTSVTIPSSVTSIERFVFEGCSGFTGNLTIPNSVTSIRRDAFSGCSGFTGNLNIPSSVTSVESYAFQGCTGFTSVTLPSSVPSIGNFAFMNCTALKQVIVDNAIPPAIYEKTFEGVDKKTCELLVPEGSEMDYLQAEYWRDFFDKPGVFHVQFNSLGGEAFCDAIALNTIIKAPTNPTKYGYTFAGWYKEEECLNPWNFTTDIVTSNITLYAKWTTNTYTVKFNSNGGIAVPDIITPFKSLIKAPVNPTRPGYTFDGWYWYSDYSVKKWDFNTEKVIKDVTLYALWNQNIYTVSFNSNGGSAVSSMQAIYNGHIYDPGSPFRWFFIFKGWYKESALTNQWNFSTDVVTSDITLYAKWSFLGLFSISNSVAENYKSSNAITETPANADINKNISALVDAGAIAENNKTTNVQTDIGNVDLRIFPNPIVDFIKIEGAKLQTVTIYDISGVKQLQKDLNGEENVIIGVANLKPGHYLVNVKTTNGHVKTKKLLKN